MVGLERVEVSRTGEERGCPFIREYGNGEDGGAKESRKTTLHWVFTTVARSCTDYAFSRNHGSGDAIDSSNISERVWRDHFFDGLLPRACIAGLEHGVMDTSKD